MVLAVGLLVSQMTGFCTESSTYISYTQTGNKGGDFQFSGDTVISGNNNRGQSTNTLYIAAQQQGYYLFGGVASTWPVAPGNVLSAHTINLSAGGYHVLLDPSGPNQSGCDGYGKLKQ